ncbi:MAG TPA: IPT/TIG domain-containing protein, partial [Pseudomonas sp.]|nr:IPT/TIG domain-containing protein [Pseudomonas sp.]
ASGVAVVDLLDPAKPQVVARVNDIGYAYDLDFNGNTLYVALGTKGVLTIDVTDPLRPRAGRSMAAPAGGSVESVVADAYSALGGGLDAQGSVLQVVPDVLLRLHMVDPRNGILDRQPDGSLQVIARFSKAIDLYPANLQQFLLLGPQGETLSTEVQILSNDAKLILASSAADNLKAGDRLTLVVKAGLASVKPMIGRSPLLLHSLAQTQRVGLTYRGARDEVLALEAVVPRRVARDQASIITVSVRGLPANLAQVHLYLGDQALQIEGVSRDNDSAPAVLTVGVPPLPRAGQYNLTLAVVRDGVQQQAVLEGALLVDAPIRLDALAPLWGPVAGDTTVTITGEGFEPGNSVMDGLKVRFGGLPVGRIEVLASNHMRVTSPRGAPGKVEVLGEDRYGNQSRLNGDQSFGYGLRKLSELHPSLIFPSDIWIDQQTGVAVTNGGYLMQGFSRQALPGGGWLPDNFRAASFSVQDASKPQLVGGTPALPSDAQRLSLKLQAMAIYQRMEKGFLASGSLEPSEEEQEILDRQAAQDFPIALDSIRIAPTLEWEENTWRKRLYVASGLAGVARLNLDEQNGLQVIQEEKLANPVSRLVKQGDGLFAASASVEARPPDDGDCVFATGASSGQGLLALNYRDGADPVRLAGPDGLKGGALLQLADGWLLSGGNIRSAAWVNCPGWSESLAAAGDAAQGEIRTLNLFDPSQQRSYDFEANPQDALVYGRYLLVAVGSRGLEIINRDQPLERVRVDIGKQLQAAAGRGVRLRLAGSLLFVAADSGVVVLDIREPLQPRVISAGNQERIEALDLFNNRLVAGSGGQGLTLLELPGALVLDASVKQGGVLPAGEQALELSFNEPVTLESLALPGALQLSELGASEQALAAPTVEALNGDGQSASRVRLRFTPTPGAQLRLRLNDARNLRGSGLWAPYQVDFRVAPAGASQPRISHLENASFHRGAQDAVVIHGTGFSGTVKGFINQYPIDLQWVSAERLEIAAHALDLLPLTPGQWHLRLDDGGLREDYLGALLVGAEQALDQVKYSVSPDSASKKGGERIAISASHEVFMPGTRVVLRARHGAT